MKTILARTLLLAGAAILPAMAGNQILLRNFNSADGVAWVFAAGGNGQLFVVSGPTSGVTRVVELDLTGTRLASLDLPQMEAATGVVLDTQGNLIVVGWPQLGSGTLQQSIVMKVDSKLLASTVLTSLPARVSALAVDRSGNVYLTGSTSSTSFPVTAGAYQTSPPGSDSFGSASFAFLTEISPAGQMLYSTYFGSNNRECDGGSYCIGKWPQTSVAAIAVASSGAVVIAGTTSSNGLPTTPGVVEPNCLCGYLELGDPAVTAGFVAKFQPGGAQLQWATYLNISLNSMYLTANAVALDSAGDVIVGGSGSSDLPAPPGVFQIPAFGANPNGGAFLLKLNSTGTAVIWNANFSSPTSVSAAYVDAQQRVAFSGSAGGTGPLSGSTYVARVSGDGSTLTDYDDLGSFGRTGAALANVSTGGFAALIGNTLWIETTVPGPSLLNIANSASGSYSNSLSGGELVTLYGVGIGPQNALSGQVQSGVFTSSLGGCQVLFNGVAAPLLYAGSGQINAVVPLAIKWAASAQIQVMTPKGLLDGPTASVASIPVAAIFQSQTGLAAALNQDGSVNSVSNPAKSGSIVSVFATVASGNFGDGVVVPLGIYNTNMEVWAMDSERSLGVVFAGDAPGLVEGVLQINFLLPDQFPFGSLSGGYPGITSVFSFTVTVEGGSQVEGQIEVIQ